MSSTEHTTMQLWGRVALLSQRGYVRVTYVVTLVFLALPRLLALPWVPLLAARIAFSASLLLMYGGGSILLLRTAYGHAWPYASWGQWAKRLFLVGAFLCIAGVACVQVVLVFPDLRISGFVRVCVGAIVAGLAILALFATAAVLLVLVALLWVLFHLLRAGATSALRRLAR